MTSGGISATPAPVKVPAPLSVDDQHSLVDAVLEASTAIPPVPLPSVVYVMLDESGKPTGSAGTDIPGPEDGPYIAISVIPPRDADVAVTPTGAPITDQMNPAHTFADPALLERNPPPAKPVAPLNGDPAMPQAA